MAVPFAAPAKAWIFARAPCPFALLTPIKLKAQKESNTTAYCDGEKRPSLRLVFVDKFNLISSLLVDDDGVYKLDVNTFLKLN